MADGKVVIDVELNSKGVGKGIDDINGRMGKVQYSGEKAALGIGKIVTALGLVAVGAKAIGMVTSALDGAISRYDTLNNFPVVLEMMGFSAEDSSKSIKRLSDGIDGLPTTLDSVASTTQRIATMTGDLDGATETTLALNNAFLASGSSSADASRGLEQYVQMLAKGEVDLQSWRSLQETMPVALNKVAEAFGFTGASAQNDLYDALKEGDVTFDQFNGKLIELSNAQGGFADLARTSSTGIATSWQNMKTAIVKGVTDVIAGIDGALGGVGSITGLIDKAKTGIQTFFTFITTNIPVAVAWLSKIKDAIEPWLQMIGAAVAAIITFMTTFSIINTLKNLITGVRTAVLMMNAAFMANPIGLVIAIIAGLIAVLVIAYNKVDWFRNAVDVAWSWLKDVTGVAFAYIKDIITKLIADAVEFASKILQKFRDFWDENGQAIMIIVESTFNFVKSFIETVMGVIKGIFQVTWPIITGIIKLAWENIKLIVQNGIDLVLGIIQTVLKLLQGDWEGAWDTIKGTAQKIWQNIEDFFRKVDLVQIGKDIIQGLIDGISSMVSSVGKAVGKVVDKIKGAITNPFAIKSPSRWMRDMVGRNLMKGFQIGIDKEKTSTIRKMSQAAEWMAPNVSDFVNGLKGVSAPISNVTPISSITGSGNSAGASTRGAGVGLDKLVGAIDKLARRPVKIAIDKYEFVTATVDEMGNALDFRKSRKESFK
ncbi:phage tail protein [Bacillus nitroreducens]